ncbi:MAG: isoprenylcysteine carboxylmethyltransferase family protein [Thermodesulfovibrionales bacterium]|nr:isoprenylcysteine carboxylmethyltransferase family protein [Thermodesulfovibrionales bacterium]
MDKRLLKPALKAIVVLPGTALIYVPAGLVWLSMGTSLAPVPPGITSPGFAAGLLLALAGLALMVSTVRLFLRYGDGTPAPWEPPRKLVIRGPYRHVRNPMLTGVICFQFAEALLIGSWPLAIWGAVFAAANALYFPLVEEKGLENRFGSEYLEYKRNVPRWVPRLKGWP